MTPAALMRTRGPFPSLWLIHPSLLHLWLLIASIYYSVILNLLNYVEIRVAEEQGEAKVVAYGETCLAGVHGAHRPRCPAFNTSIHDSCAGWAVRPLWTAVMGQGEVGAQHQVRYLGGG